MRPHRPALLGLACCLSLAVLASCREGPSPDRPADGGAPCTSVGQRCEFSPGKLGSCVQRDECTSGNCFVCQSQH